MVTNPSLNILEPTSVPSFLIISLYTLPRLPSPIAEKTLSAPAIPNPLITEVNSDCSGFSCSCCLMFGPANATVDPAANSPNFNSAPPAIIAMLIGALSAKPLPINLKAST